MPYIEDEHNEFAALNGINDSEISDTNSVAISPSEFE
jgi:hypothetical protein